ncbi:MAG: xanthine dehydrogenase molybdopterin binding subunit [Myxococcota bacterium]|nr:xanthine dehydrogenase molybdopterin binding subunit [Myxococcota bacterium]
MNDRRIVGRAIAHESAEGHVTGAALYTDDLATRTAGVLSAWPVMSPHAHAWLDRLDVAPAVDVPGVVKVLTIADVPGENDTGASRRDEPLFPRPPAPNGHGAAEGEREARAEIHFAGMPVAWVLAETEEAAKLGAARVIAEYTPRPAIVTIEQAIDAGSFLSDVERIARGNVEGALQQAPHRLDGELYVGGQEQFYLETQASIAFVDEAGSTFVHSSTQHPTETQEVVARVLGVPASRVVVQQLRMGGGFGGKETQANPYASVAAIGAHVTGRPVRVRLDRARDVVLTGKRHPFLGRFRVGFDRDGKLLAMKLELWSDGGWSLDLSLPVLGRALFHADNAYLVPAMEVTGRVCRTNKASNTAFRGFGGPQGMVMIEEVLDRVARALGLPADVVREKNLYREGDETHYGMPVEGAERLGRIWRELRTEADWAVRRESIDTFNASSPHAKRGLAITPVKFGISFTAKYYNQAGALVLIYKDGSVQVSHGGTEMGQGLHTKVLQIAAETLGVPLDVVRIMPTRTDKVPNTSATAASAGTDLNGAAVKNSCEILRARLVEVGARMLGVEPSDVIIESARVFPRGAPERAIAWSAVVDRAYHERVQLSANGFYKTPEIHWDREKGRGRPFYYFAYGAAITELEVDGFTGMYGVRRVDILHDVGDSISPLIDLGQVEGGFAQGVGWLTQEELVWDEEGRLRTTNASTYKLPSLGECPPIFRAKLLPRATQPGVVFGSKAVGEPPLMLALSVREALRDAVAAFAQPGRRAPVILRSPATPESVFWAIDALREEERVTKPDLIAVPPG